MLQFEIVLVYFFFTEMHTTTEIVAVDVIEEIEDCYSIDEEDPVVVHSNDGNDSRSSKGN
jgi:hypothetical protein